MNSKVLAPVALIPFLVCLTVAQEKIAPRLPNISRIAKAWNSINPHVEDVNKNMARAGALLHASFGGRVLDLNEERRAQLELERRKARVGYYKAALSALDSEREALITLIEEEDY